MATASYVRLKDYLGLDFRPDREYVDGEIRERNAGNNLPAIFAQVHAA